MSVERRGRKRIPNDCFKRVVDFIKNKTEKGEEFSSIEISEATGILIGTVNVLLWRKYKEGRLSRRREGRYYFYRQIGYIFEPSTSKGRIADCVWEVLHLKPRIFRKELHEQVKNILKNVRNFSVSSIDKVVSSLFHDGCITKFGTGRGGKEIEYSLNIERWYDERPVVVN